jgi:hypothetical protein
MHGFNKEFFSYLKNKFMFVCPYIYFCITSCKIHSSMLVSSVYIVTNTLRVYHLLPPEVFQTGRV